MIPRRMSSVAKQVFQSARPPGFVGRGDKYLATFAQGLRRVLWKTQRSFVDPTCRLPDAAWTELAVLLVEWAEDIHNDLGLWRTVEAHQRQLFGTPLPFVHDTSADELQGFDSRRIQYLLWNLWPCFNPEQVISPTHPDLKYLADAAGRFLTDQMAAVPRDSGLKRFLATPNDYAWDIKRKLLWVGINSYLFRFLFFKYLDDGQREPDIATKDDFVCGHCTEWAGLGVVNVLDGALDLPEADRTTLRTWYERHWSFFRVLTRHVEDGEVKTITVKNMVNGQPYTIRMNIADCPFVPGLVVFGALTPWRDEWCWSGAQKTFQNMPEHEDANLRKEMLKASSAIAYRFCPEEAEQAREFTRKLHEKFVAHYGSDLVVFPDGLALAASEQKRMDADWAATDPEQLARLKEQGGLSQPSPRMKIPPEFLNNEGGIGTFSNPEEGVEFMVGFKHFLSGLRKKADGLTDDERCAIRGFVTNASTSAAFVRRVATDHGVESIAETFQLPADPPDLALEFLLRRHKGHFFRKRYPSLSILHLVE
jgi:hypothetical protein